MIRAFVNLLAYVALYAAFLFGPAGTLRWPAAWVLLGVLFLARGMSAMVLYRRSRALLVERARLPLQRGQSPADKVLLPAYMASVAAEVAFVSWDRWHRHLLGSPAFVARSVGLLLFLIGCYIVHVALRSNPFAVTVVRHQTERGHEVVREGPYSLVRHPMYVGLVLEAIGLPLWLGSTAGVLASIVPVGVLVIRIVAEEHMLAASLADYPRYVREVRWRLVPRLW